MALPESTTGLPPANIPSVNSGPTPTIPAITESKITVPGSDVSRVRRNSSESGLLFPAGSKAFARRNCKPSTSKACPSVERASVQYPSASDLVVPRRVVPVNNWIFRSDSAIPLRTIARELATLSPGLPISGETLSMVGANSGATVSRVRTKLRAWLLFPAASIWASMRLWPPSACPCKSRLNDHFPFEPTRALPTTGPSKPT